MGWKERGWYFGPSVPDLFDRNGNAGPLVFVDGLAVGTWAQRPDGQVVTELLEPVSHDDRTGIAAAADAHRVVRRRPRHAHASRTRSSAASPTADRQRETFRDFCFRLRRFVAPKGDVTRRTREPLHTRRTLSTLAFAVSLLVLVVAWPSTVDAARIARAYSPGVTGAALGGDLVVNSYGVTGLGLYRMTLDDGSGVAAVCIQADVSHSTAASYQAAAPAYNSGALDYLTWRYLRGAAVGDVQAAGLNLAAWASPARDATSAAPSGRAARSPSRCSASARGTTSSRPPSRCSARARVDVARGHSRHCRTRGRRCRCDSPGRAVRSRTSRSRSPSRAGARTDVVTGADGIAVFSPPDAAAGTTVRATAAGPGRSQEYAAAGSQRVAVAGVPAQLAVEIPLPAAPTTTTSSTTTSTSTSTTSTSSTTTTSTTSVPTTSTSTRRRRRHVDHVDPRRRRRRRRPRPRPARPRRPRRRPRWIARHPTARHRPRHRPRDHDRAPRRRAPRRRCRTSRPCRRSPRHPRHPRHPTSLRRGPPAAGSCGSARCSSRSDRSPRTSLPGRGGTRSGTSTSTAAISESGPWASPGALVRSRRGRRTDLTSHARAEGGAARRRRRVAHGGLRDPPSRRSACRDGPAGVRGTSWTRPAVGVVPVRHRARRDVRSGARRGGRPRRSAARRDRRARTCSSRRRSTSTARRSAAATSSA